LFIPVSIPFGIALLMAPALIAINFSVIIFSSIAWIYLSIAARRLTPRSSGPDCVGPLSFFR
jgi:hypothetical protein